MVKDNLGNLYTDYELLKKRINEVNLDVKATEELMDKLNSFSNEISNTHEYKFFKRQLLKYYRTIKDHLPEDNQNVVDNMDNCFDKILTAYKEYFYIEGYKEGKTIVHR
ncbi:MAG: hypothetical protein A2Y21_07730 [Clostridiales bacterium GWC2_40_7]|nr:MAG: hypothetical protein A2Y21_07730 [Clostridiales bacterium GWC2_40_7]